jgi:hypothetical protein
VRKRGLDGLLLTALKPTVTSIAAKDVPGAFDLCPLMVCPLEQSQAFVTPHDECVAQFWMVNLLMLCGGQHHQIFDPVVRLLAIDVVDVFHSVIEIPA